MYFTTKHCILHYLQLLVNCDNGPDVVYFCLRVSVFVLLVVFTSGFHSSVSVVVVALLVCYCCTFPCFVLFYFHPSVYYYRRRCCCNVVVVVIYFLFYLHPSFFCLFVCFIVISTFLLLYNSML